jgi:hypothetical protein
MASDTELPTGATSDPGGAGSADEDKHAQLTRNLNELLQELRVMQTGVQILTGFLLTIPFTARFGEINASERFIYLAVLCGSVVATALITAPVAFHRTLFRRGEREWIVEAANRAARYGLAALALTMAGVVWLVFDVVVGAPTSHVAAGISVGLFALLWGIWPVASRRRLG